MEFVPFAFSYAVCAVLKDPDALVTIPSHNSNSGIWNVAAVATKAVVRVTIQVCIDFKDGVWFYRIFKLAQNRKSQMTFNELKAISRRCVQTSVVAIGYSDADSHISTLDEVRKVLKYSAQFVNFAEMRIARNLKIPDDVIDELLLPFCNLWFSRIYAFNHSKAAEEFFTTQLQNGGLKIIATNDKGELRLAIQSFALAQPFEYESVHEKSFSFTFLKALFSYGWRTFTDRFDVNFETLRMFNKELQIHSGDKTIVWRRRDGVEVKISRLRKGRLCMEFSLLLFGNQR